MAELLQAGHEVIAAAVTVAGGPDMVWLGAAMIIGAGATSFEMLRYVSDRFLVLPRPASSANPVDPISIRDAVRASLDAVFSPAPKGGAA